jgi:imidazolonepropionase-like amidohydrolase
MSSGPLPSASPPAASALLRALVFFGILAAGAGGGIWVGAGAGAAAGIAAGAAGGIAAGTAPEAWQEAAPDAPRAAREARPAGPAPGDSLPSGSFLIRGVRLFDGETTQTEVDVLVRDGRIAAIGEMAAADEAGLPVVDGAGRTLLPSLVDAHVHAFSDGVHRQALAFGVGVQLDMFAMPALLEAWRGEQREGRAAGRADVLGAGYLATAPGGHGTQFGLAIPTLTRPEEADGWVEARVAEGADWVKIVLETGQAFGMERSSLDEPTLEALVKAAHARGLLAVVHVSRLADAERAVRAGADGLVHLWVDGPPPEALAAEMARAGMFVVPTLVVQETMLEAPPSGWNAQATLADEAAARWLDPDARSGLAQRFQIPRPFSWNGMAEAVRRLDAAGVPLLVGSDAPNPGTTYGASVHREMELLVAAGLPPETVLAGATSRAADAFRLTRREGAGAEHPGRVQVGAPAHLLLVEGDPTTTIADTRRIVGVWKGGVAFDHAALATQVAEVAAAAEGPVAALPLEDGRLVVGSFDDGTLAAPQGSWVSTTDQMAGGSSTAVLSVVEGGAGGTPGALRVQGEVAPGLPFAWAGALYMPGSQPFAPVDASAADGVALRLQLTQGTTLQISLFSEATGTFPVAHFVEAAALSETAGPDGWTSLFLPWDRFQGIDPSRLTALMVAAGPAPGPFDLMVDEVAFAAEGG